MASREMAHVQGSLMPATRYLTFVTSAGAMLAAAAAITLPASVGLAAEPTPVATGYDVDPDHSAQFASADPQIADADVACMAKVVLHEAGHEPRDGKVAVAQTLMNRLATGRMGASICEVVNQPGQFFRTAAYNPDQDGAGWQDAVAVSRAVLTGTADSVAPGAIFFRSAAYPASGFFRSRQRIASVGAQIFYR